MNSFKEPETNEILLLESEARFVSLEKGEARHLGAALGYTGRFAPFTSPVFYLSRIHPESRLSFDLIR